MPSAAQFWSCYSGSNACSHHPASNWFLVPVANAGRSASGGLARGKQPKRHETVWRAVASRKGGWDNKWRNLATFPESLPGPACLNDERSAAGRNCASDSSYAFARADTIGFTVSVAAASSSTRWEHRVDCRRICVAAGSSVSLSRINCRLGQ
jgi:hypothetical protein